MSTIKDDVKKLKALLEVEGVKIKLGKCYEIYSKMNGFKNWDTMSAQVKSVEKKPQVSLAPTTYTTIPDFSKPYVDPIIEANPKLKKFEVTVEALCKVRKWFPIYAKSKEEALEKSLEENFYNCKEMPNTYQAKDELKYDSYGCVTEWEPIDTATIINPKITSIYRDSENEWQEGEIEKEMIKKGIDFYKMDQKWFD